MRRASLLTARSRAILGVIALYGLLLQGFLSAAIPVLTPDLLGVICAPHADAPGPDGGQPARHDHACCTVAAPSLATPPDAPGSIAAWAPPAATRITWRPEAIEPHAGPPQRPGSARGPPAA